MGSFSHFLNFFSVLFLLSFLFGTLIMYILINLMMSYISKTQFLFHFLFSLLFPWCDFYLFNFQFAFITLLTPNSAIQGRQYHPLFRNEKQKARLARSHHKEVAEWSSHPTCLRQSQGGPRMLATGTYCLGTGPRPHPINSRRHCTRVASLAPAGAGWPLYCSSII